MNNNRLKLSNKNHFNKSYGFILLNYFLLLLLIIVSHTSFSQATPSVRVKTKEFQHFVNTNDTKDWVFHVIEDANLDFAFAGYTSEDETPPATTILPSMGKIDKDFTPQWTLRFNDAFDIDASGSPNRTFAFFGSLFGIEEYVDPDDGETYYVGVGYAAVTVSGGTNAKLIIVKVDVDGNIEPGYPRIYLNDLGLFTTTNPTWERRGRAIRYVPGDPDYFYIAGSEQGVPCIYRIDETLDHNTLTKVTAPGSGLDQGDLKAMCIQYTYGSLPDGKPAPGPGGIPNPPLNIWATGIGYDVGASPSFTKSDSSILIVKVSITGTWSSTTANVAVETSPTPPSTYWSTGGPPWWIGHTPSMPSWYAYSKPVVSGEVGQISVGPPVIPHPCQDYFRKRTSADMGMSIIQLLDGRILCAGLANIRHDNLDKLQCFDSPPLHPGLYEWTDADVFAMLIDPTNFPTPTQYTGSSSGYRIDCQHVGHMSGMDYNVKVRQDYDENFYFTGSNGDPGKVQQSGGTDLWSNFYVIKTEVDFTYIWDETYHGGLSSSPSCGFAATVCKNNELVVGGDNKNEQDNYDFIRLSRDCAINYDSYSGPQFISDDDDGVTISVKDDLLGGGTGTYTVTANKKIKGRLIIENNCVVNVNGYTLEFADMDQLVDLAYDNGFENGIVIKSGGKLVLENGAVLTSLAVCEDKWRGVKIEVSGSPSQTTPSTIGILEMTDSKIANAGVGVSVNGGGLITCTNTSANYNHVNFENCRKGVAFEPFSGNNLSRFNFTNFLFTLPNKDWSGVGLNTHCSMFGVDNIIFNGCTFKNNYVGPFRLGFGLAAFDATFHVLIGNDATTGGCSGSTFYPSGRQPVFENLTYGINSDRTPATPPSDFIGVGEAQFINCGVGWACDNDFAPLAYKNVFEWNDVLHDYPMPNGDNCFGLTFGTSDDLKIFENDFTTLSGSTDPIAHGIIISNPTLGGPFTSSVKGNEFTTLGAEFNIGLLTLGDNDNFELKWNTFDVDNRDWINNGTMQDQGSAFNNLSNTFTVSPGIDNIYSASGAFVYFDVASPSLSGAVSWASSTPPSTPVALNPCDVYEDLSGNKFRFENLSLVKKPEQVIWENIKVKNFSEAKTLTKELKEGDYKTFLEIAISILESKRELKPTPGEIEMLTSIALGENEASLNAKHFLSFFLEILIKDEIISPTIFELNSNAAVSEIQKRDLQEFKIYPNPSTGIFNFEWKVGAFKPLSLIITDLNGRQIVELENLSATYQVPIDLRSFESGLYMYKLFGEGYIKTGKIVLSK